MQLPTRIAIRSLMVAAFACACLGAPGTAAASGPRVVKRAISFEVRNSNRSVLACPTDRATYEVTGHLIGPAAEVDPDVARRHRAVTLYLHDFAFGEFVWHLAAVPRYDYATAMARAGHVSVVIDRLGYGSSGHPPGNRSCLGGQADVAHQIIGKLRSGDYALGGGEFPPFDRVALAGHSAGGLIANLEALSFNDVDALAVIGHTPQVTLGAFGQWYAGQAVCDAGGEPAVAGGAPGYAYFGQTDADFQAAVFHSADPAVVEAATRLRARDPCGDSRSIVDGLVVEVKSLSRVRVPVLVVCGTEDAVTPDFACPYLKQRYVGSRDASLSFVPQAGHALPLERRAWIFRRNVSRWLSAHGF